VTGRVVLPPIACRLALALAAHARQLKEAPRARQRLLTYDELRRCSGQSFAVVGIGQHLQRIVDALHDQGLPYGLTLLVWSKEGRIDYQAGEWYGISPENSLEHRRRAVEFDWSGVEFVESR
jgi:hypothetical protein